jgi:3-hydroxyisobutyrate dehydrogenase-like beta-hydroxyacid dehydrogenase
VTERREAIGLIGIGLVGAALAENLLARGFAVVGYDLDPRRCALLGHRGGAEAGRPAEVGTRTGRVLLSLMDSATVAEVVEGPGGLLDAALPPRVVLDTSPGDPDATEAIARRLGARGVRFLDAPISGSSEQIREREALFMVGGEREDFDACADLLDAITARAVHVGPAGAGARAKLASNLILGLNRLALAEGLVFAETLGLEPRRFLDVLQMSAAYSVAVDAKGEKMLRGDYSPQSRIAQHRKDVALILAHAKAAGLDLPLSRVHLDILDALIRAGDGGLDCAAVIEAIRRRRAPPGATRGDEQPRPDQ